MRVSTWVEICQEIDVEISIAEVMSSISALADGDQPGMIADCVSNAWRVLHSLTDAQIALLSESSRITVSGRLKEQAERFHPGPIQLKGEQT